MKFMLRLAHMPDTHLILHVKGTEQDTTSLPKQVVRAAISQGQITHSQLIWSPLHNAWKQVRELPQLWPSQKLAPAPKLRGSTGDLPKISAEPAPQPQVAGAPRVAAKAVAAGAPKVKAASPVAKPAVAVKASAPSSSGSGDFVVKEAKGPQPIKWLCFGLAGLILLSFVFNYFFVHRPLMARLAQTTSSNVSAYAHLGAFIQPGVIIIHIPASSSYTEESITATLVDLAKSTPDSPVTRDTYDRVALTSGWMGNYSFSGRDWKELGRMGSDELAQRKEFILTQMRDASGQSLASGNPNLSEDARQAERDKIWADFLAYFGSK